jgi:hypothetical protein
MTYFVNFGTNFKPAEPISNLGAYGSVEKKLCLWALAILKDFKFDRDLKVRKFGKVFF